jgi:uncharacterized protein YbjT (DUF2867 family)
MIAPRTVVVAGASGLTGGHIIDCLLQASEYGQVVALVRKPLGRTHPKLREMAVDFEKANDFRVDDVYCAVGTTIKKAGSQAAFLMVDRDVPLQLAKWAIDRGASQYALVSSVSSDPQSGNFYLRVKGQVEEQLNAMRFRAVHVARPSFLLGDRGERRGGEQIGITAAALLQPLLVGGLRKYRSIPAQTVGRALVHAMVQGEQGRFVYHFDQLQELAG